MTDQTHLAVTDPATGAERRYSYVLVTPARNEEAFIELTLKSVTAQEIRPLKWVIVSDGSTDRTDAIVSGYAARHPWIELLRMPERKERHFGGKVRAFNAGYARLGGLDYQAIGSLDADISFGPDYFKFLLRKLAENPRLGLVGTPHVENNKTYDYRFASLEHVSGACQFFRRECFEAIGGYLPLESGGVDLVAVFSARLKGWETRTFRDITCEHHRVMGSATKGRLTVLFDHGKKDYLLGAHAGWVVLRTAYRIIRPPYVVGAAVQFFGYFSYLVRGKPRSAPREVVVLRQQEQGARLRAVLRGFFFPWTKARSPGEPAKARD